MKWSRNLPHRLRPISWFSRSLSPRILACAIGGEDNGFRIEKRILVPTILEDTILIICQKLIVPAEAMRIGGVAILRSGKGIWGIEALFLYGVLVLYGISEPSLGSRTNVRLTAQGASFPSKSL